MRRAYQRTVSTNAEPSRANWHAESPRTCRGCGVRLYITKDHIFFRMYPNLETWCSDCRPHGVVTLS